MTPQDRAMVASLCADLAGLSIDPDKGYLLENRLAPIARREAFSTLEDMLQALRDSGDERLSWAVVEAMSPSESSFFRDPHTFEALQSDILAGRMRPPAGAGLRVWVAACGGGQEVYSLAMLLDEAAPTGAALDICASDISERRLEKARSGVYSQFEVQRGLSARRLVRHFEKREDSFVLTQRIRQTVRWRRVNLLEDLAPFGQFDLVVCRNVLSGMTPSAAAAVLRSLEQRVASGGRLVLGLKDPAPDLEAASDGAGIYRVGGGRNVFVA